MAGVVPYSSCPPCRKQWNIRDRKSTRRLRSHLAEDGCPESQLVLAKQLLQEKSVVSDSDENARLGVFWLIKASEQGNVEATDILRNCLETGEGITEHNYLDVKTCLNTPQNEKLAKRAAREMFMSLSAGQDFITSEQLQRRMKKIDLCETVPKPKNLVAKAHSINGSTCLDSENVSINSAENAFQNDDCDCDCPDSSLDWSGKEDFGEKLTEDHLEKAAVSYSRGELPLVQRVLTLTEPRNREIQNLSYLQRVLLHPFQTVYQSCLQLLEHFSPRHGDRTLNLLPNSSFVQLLAVLIIYPLMSLENVLLVVPMFVYYVSFFAMIFSTLQMLQTKREYSSFRIWSRLFLRYDRDGNLNTEDAEFEYCKNNLRPFVVYFLSLLVNLASYPFISEMWLPQSEFAIVAFALTFTTLYHFHEKLSTNKIDFLMLFSFGINVLAKYPYETDGVVRQTWRFLDIELPSLQNYGLPCFASQIVGNGVEFCLNFRGFFYLLMPVIFINMASRESWKGTYRVLIPHCVTLSWWQVAVLCCQGATLYGLIRSTLALVGLIFFLPIVGFATVILPVFAVLEQFTDITLTPKTGVTTVLASIPLILAYVIDKRRSVFLGTYFSKIQIFLGITSAFILLSPCINQHLADTGTDSEIQVQPVITWDQYSSLCQKSTWNKRTTASIQEDCLHFKGVSVNWEGIVEDVKIVKINNNLLRVVEHLPQSLRLKLICLYGEKYMEDCTETSDGLKMQLCQVLKQHNSKSKCHAKSWDKYDFEIKLGMKSNKWNGESTIHLQVDDCLRNFTLNLRVKDHIWFSGSLNHPETIGSENLKITVDEIGCINCENESLTSLKVQRSKFRGHNFFTEIQNGCKRILNFVFNPLLIFR